MIDKGTATQVQGDVMLRDWHVQGSNPDALFFSPIVVGVAAKLVK
jgi:hypothetical protein